MGDKRGFPTKEGKFLKGAVSGNSSQFLARLVFSWIDCEVTAMATNNLVACACLALVTLTDAYKVDEYPLLMPNVRPYKVSVFSDSANKTKANSIHENVQFDQLLFKNHSPLSYLRFCTTFNLT